MPPRDTKQVLIVDDEPLDIENTGKILESTGGFAVYTASDYTEAVGVFERHGAEIDLALIDVALPGKNGVELAKTLLAARPDLRVIFVSGHVGASVIRFYGINAGDEHFVQKPFEAETLLAKVRHALSSNHPLQFILSASNSGPHDDETRDR
jgi:DNA-binding response OmpR family regulator